MKNFVETNKTSQTFKAPLGLVFRWRTDFKVAGSKAKRTFLEKDCKESMPGGKE